ncbi:MAG: molybdopterin-binding protein [Pseudomonadota bacterium]
MKSVRVEDAVGMILCHDITEIVPDLFKGRAFKKGHVIVEQDIPRLLDLGKRYVFVSDFEGRVHEDDAARRIAAAACGQGLDLSEPNEGKITFTARGMGLFKVRANALEKINDVQDVMMATLHTNQTVKPGQGVAGTRIIPLSTEESNILSVESICKDHFPVIEVKPFMPFEVGMVTTGSEVYTGRIKDGFGPVVREKFRELGSQVFRQILVSDELDMTVGAIHELMAEGAQMIAVTGGMSVDPDDQTPSAIVAAGGEVVTYGAPVLPGAMFMLAYIGKIPVIGLPGCVMYHKASIFDLVVPRLLAGEILVRSDILGMGHGGYCSSCKVCRYPLCAFGKEGA